MAKTKTEYKTTTPNAEVRAKLRRWRALEIRRSNIVAEQKALADEIFAAAADAGVDGFKVGDKNVALLVPTTKTVFDEAAAAAENPSLFREWAVLAAKHTSRVPGTPRKDIKA